MRKRLFNQQSEPGSREAATAQRLSVKARIMMALFALMLIPQVTWAQSDVDYMGYDTTTGKFVKTKATSGNYTTLTANSPTTLTDGKTYVVTGTETMNNRLDVDGTVNIILCDGATFTANWGITVSTGDVLNIYAQGEGTGKLIAKGINDAGTLYAAIGSTNNMPSHSTPPADYGYVNIYGGQILADASTVDGVTGIGGFYSSQSCFVTSYGGNVVAKGGSGAVGIYNLKLGNGVTYYGGDSEDPTTVVTDGTRYRYMSTKENVYNLTVDGKKVRTTNLNDILFSGGTTPTASFDPSDANTTNAGTLKLNGLQITGDITSGLAELTIEISGDNTLHASSTISEDGHIICTATAGTLTFTKASGATGTSSLELNAANSYSVIQGFTSVTAGNDVYFQYGNPYEYNTTDKKMAWLNGTPVQGFLVTTQPSYPLWICDTHASYQAIDGNVSVGGDDIPFTVSSTTYTLTLNNKNLDYQHIISDLDNLTIELVGTNTMNDSDPTVHSDVNPIIESLNNSATLTFKNSGTGMASLVMSNDASGSSIISGFNSVVAGTGLFWTASGAITYDSTNGLLVGTTPAHNATIGVQSYPLWIGSTQVTSANAGNIRNDGTLSYVHDATNNTGTLTLNGVTLNGGDISTSMSDLTIHVKGNNKISAASNCIRSSATTPGKLTFTKDTGGKLELDNASNGYSVIKGFNDVDGVPLETKAPYEIYTDGNYYRLKQLLASDTASIDIAWVYADTTYPLWVDGSQATSVSANNILGDAGSTASFNSNTLTLNVANIPGAIVSSLTSTLTISVKGNSTVSGGIFQTSNATADLVVSKDATATGNVSLLVNPGREAAIRGFSSFTYTDFVPFNSSGTTDLSDGISYDNSKALKYNGTALGAVYLLSKTDLATAGLTFTMASVAYTGAAVVLPTTATMDNGTTQTTLTQTTDYTVTGYKASDKTALTSAPIAAGNYYATIQGNGIYTGTADAAFTIDQADFTKITLTIDAITAQTYTGSEIKPTPTVTFGTTPLVAGTDFDYSYANNTNAALSTATPAPTVTVTGKGNFTGTALTKFTINPLTVTLSWGNTTFVYNGTAQAPTATVTNLVGTDVCNVTVGGAETAAGSYTATATALSNANYQLPASPTTTFTILDRTATIDFGDRTFKTYYDANETFIVPDGTTAYIVTGVSGNAVTIQKVSYIKAGVPVLLESTPGSTVAKNVSETFTGNLLKYAAAATPATEKHYLLYKNEFVRASGTISNKVYLDLAGYSGGARSLVIGDGATAIEGIVIDEEDGDAKWYDMQGRRINKPTKAGLYIKDGQKVVVKTRY